MSKKRKRKAGLLAAAACLATALMATPVSAALSDAEKEALAQNIHDYLTATFTMTEENKAELREAGGYYDIVLDELEKTNEKGFLFALPEEIGKKYSIPSAFEVYVKHAGIEKPGMES